MREIQTEEIDGALKEKVLKRLGFSEGEVEIKSESWDFGMCDTCSFPEEGFSVYVDNKLVWPNDECLDAFGGYIYADRDGQVQGKTLSVWGYFFDWIDGKDLMKIADELEQDE